MAWAVTSALKQEVDSPARDVRRYLGMVVGVEGIRTVGDLAVSQRAGGAAMSVDIAAGAAMVQGDTAAYQGFYLVYNDAVYTLSGFATPHATNPRIDRVVASVHDHAEGDADNTDAPVILTGTATSGATLTNLTGAAAIGNGQLLLANVLVRAATSSILDSDIDTDGHLNNTVAVRPLMALNGNVNLKPPFVGFPFGLDIAVDAGVSIGTDTLVLAPFWLPVPGTISAIDWVLITASGTHNSDVGIYNSAGTLLGSSGSSGVGGGGAAVRSTLSAPVLLPAGAYYLAWCQHRTSGSGTTELGRCVPFGSLYQLTMTGAVPLPNPITIGSATAGGGIAIAAAVT